MEPTLPDSRHATSETSRQNTLEQADANLATVSSLLSTLTSEVDVAQDSADLAFENRLVQVRLGLASGLFGALRARHAPTAAHCLRVALGCSAWSASLSLAEEQRDSIEVGALLHDVGKIGIPDHILLKPGKLSPEEYLTVEQHRRVGLGILSHCCASGDVLAIVQHSGAWFDGSRDGYNLSGDDLPMGARMVSIVDAFDAMTTDQIYRRAMSRERALAELFEFAGTQFDPQLVQDFCAYISSESASLPGAVARRWLKQLSPENSNEFWRLEYRAPAAPSTNTCDAVFQHKLLESMHDAVIFVDNNLQIVHWNRAAERLTGIAASSIEHKKWSPSLVSLRDEKERLIDDPECPVIQAIKNGVQTVRRLSVTGRNGQRVDIDAHLVPVHGKNGLMHGAAVLLHDASSRITLEQRVQTLHEKATRDPLTQVANRAEFDEIHATYVQSHRDRRLPFSLIICDIDYFKRINDNFGHQAGDEVLQSFAALLRRHTRPGDLVARYGGEEFVLLCIDCDNTAATRRAEELRRELAEFPMAALGNKSITASFGVTELQNGDTPETMLRRADRALYQAKESGRNTVIQLGSGIDGEEPAPRATGWLSWLRGTTPDQLLSRTLVTSVPLNVVVEKMRGFMADHHAEIVSIAESHLTLRIDGENTPFLRRNSDRPVPFFIEMKFSEATVPAEGRGNPTSRTIVHVTIRPHRSRDRRRRDAIERAGQLLLSLKSYLVAQEVRGPSDLTVIPNTKVAPTTAETPSPTTTEVEVVAKLAQDPPKVRSFFSWGSK